MRRQLLQRLATQPSCFAWQHGWVTEALDAVGLQLTRCAISSSASPAVEDAPASSSSDGRDSKRRRSNPLASLRARSSSPSRPHKRQKPVAGRASQLPAAAAAAMDAADTQAAPGSGARHRGRHAKGPGPALGTPAALPAGAAAALETAEAAAAAALQPGAGRKRGLGRLRKSQGLATGLSADAAGVAASMEAPVDRKQRRRRSSAGQKSSAAAADPSPPAHSLENGQSPAPPDAVPSKGNGRTQQQQAAAGAAAEALAADDMEDAAEAQTDVPQQPPSLPSYDQLMLKRRGTPLLPAEEAAVRAHVKHLRSSKGAQDEALALYVTAQLFQHSTASFEDMLLSRLPAPACQSFEAAELGQLHDGLFNLYASFVLDRFRGELQAFKERVDTVDMRQSHLWYPVARALERRIVYHAGPTNSGKTYSALQALKAAESGIYCGPLRLLAMEVYDALNVEGTFCNLVTGQERKMVPAAQHTACTLEMTNVGKVYDVAIIDEIQLIGDRERGWAWTRALQGLGARQVHLCGDGSALPVVRQLCGFMGEELEVQEYSRFGRPLEVERQHLREGYRSVQAGDCVVAFSRKDIFEIKADIERNTGHKVCVVYGALPPEMRRQQARLFNEPGNGYDVLVASDAVGMGLNLHIRRIIFHTLFKFEGRVQIKQIAGRAGRRGSIYPRGVATCLQAEHMPLLRSAVQAPLSSLEAQAAGLFPEFQHLELLAGKVPDDTLAQLLQRYSEEAKLEGTYFFCRQDNVLQLAMLLERVANLSLEDRFKFCMAPVRLRDPRQASALLHFAACYARGDPVTLDVTVPDMEHGPQTAEELRMLEATHQVVSLWVYLSLRFGDIAFPGQQRAIATSNRLVELMEQGLINLGQHLDSPARAQPPRRSAADRAGMADDRLKSILLTQDKLAADYLQKKGFRKLIEGLEWRTPAAQQRAEAAAA